MCVSASNNEVIASNVLQDIRNTKASKPRGDSKMGKETEKDTSQAANASVPLDQFTKAHSELSELRVETKSKDAELAKANETVAALQGQVASITAAFTKGAQQLDGILPEFSSRVSEGNPENFFSILAQSLQSDKQAKDELQAKLKAALDSVAKIEENARNASRDARIDIVLAGIASEAERKEKKDKLSASVKSLNDEEFNNLLETIADISPKVDAAKPNPFAKKEDKDKEKDKKEKAKEMASLLGVSEDAALAVLQALSSEDASDGDDEVIQAVLASVKPAEQTPSPGAEQPEGIDLSKSFASLVSSMMSAHKPNGDE
jgi:hypothetical protein